MPLLSRILLPVDFSARAFEAARFAIPLAEHFSAEIILLHVLTPYREYGAIEMAGAMTEILADRRRDAGKHLASLFEAELAGRPVRRLLLDGDPAAEIVECARREDAGLIVMPTHGYGPFRRMLLGSVTAKVLHDSKIPVWTDAHCPEPSHRAHPKPRRILAALDLKPESLRTLEVALQLGRESDARVEIVHAAPEGEVSPLHSEARLRQLLADAEREQLLKIEQEAGTEVDLVIDSANVAERVRS